MFSSPTYFLASTFTEFIDMRGQNSTASYANKAAYRAQQTGQAIWDKVTHMDAYDVGSLTFEVTSLFVGPAAVGKMAKGTTLGAKAAEMISLAKNSTKARILANVETWGSKVDNILAKSPPNIRQFGEKVLDTRIPVGIRRKAVAFAGEMGSKPAFSAESKTLREVMHFSSKHADDVVVPKILDGYTELSEFMAKVAKSDIPLDEKVKKLHQAFDNLANKSDINVPSDSQYLKGFTEWGTPDYDWPPKLGYQEDTIRGITREAGLPDTWDRYGYMGGGNFSDVPSTGPYSYGERDIPYVENPEAYHTGVFNRETYFDKIDAIKDGDLNRLNQILEREGIDLISQEQLMELSDKYKKYLSDTTSSLNISKNEAQYGVRGKAAAWGGMPGGAEQLVTPFNGLDMKHLGMIGEL